MGFHFKDKRFWIGIGISLFFIFMLFRKIDYAKLWEALREMDYRLLLPVVVLIFVSYYFRALRWRILLLPLKRTEMGKLFPATVIGYMANNLLPARLGEIIRAYVLAQKENLPVSSTFASLVLDRLCDGFSVLIILLITFFTVKLPQGMEPVQQKMVTGGYVTLGLYILVIIFLAVLKRWTTQTLLLMGSLLRPFPHRFTEKVLLVLDSFVRGVQLPATFKDMAGLVLTSVAIWVFSIWPIDILLQAFSINLPLVASMFIMVFLVFAVMIPAAPGYIGTYHVACVYGLRAFGIPLEKSLSVALVLHGIGFFPVIFVGFYYLWRDNISLRSVEEQSTRS
jgi:uncharacterized protein (TIRG00374 family)